jgi:hypothetical protein
VQHLIAGLAVDGLFSMGAAAVYVPPGGGAGVPCRVVIKGGDDLADAGAGLRLAQATRLIDVRQREVPSPAKGGTFQLISPATGLPDGEVMAIHAAPRREDPLRLVWTCEVPPR